MDTTQTNTHRSTDTLHIAPNGDRYSIHPWGGGTNRITGKPLSPSYRVDRLLPNSDTVDSSAHVGSFSSMARAESAADAHAGTVV
jgi:hypothetical protein